MATDWNTSQMNEGSLNQYSLDFLQLMSPGGDQSNISNAQLGLGIDTDDFMDVQPTVPSDFSALNRTNFSAFYNPLQDQVYHMDDFNGNTLMAAAISVTLPIPPDQRHSQNYGEGSADDGGQVGDDFGFGGPGVVPGDLYIQDQHDLSPTTNGPPVTFPVSNAVVEQIFTNADEPTEFNSALVHLPLVHRCIDRAIKAYSTVTQVSSHSKLTSSIPRGVNIHDGQGYHVLDMSDKSTGSKLRSGSKAAAAVKESKASELKWKEIEEQFTVVAALLRPFVNSSCAAQQMFSRTNTPRDILGLFLSMLCVQGDDSPLETALELAIRLVTQVVPYKVKTFRHDVEARTSKCVWDHVARSLGTEGWAASTDLRLESCSSGFEKIIVFGAIPGLTLVELARESQSKVKALLGVAFKVGAPFHGFFQYTNFAPLSSGSRSPQAAHPSQAMDGVQLRLDSSHAERIDEANGD
ncbi:hypothetical protein NMY22_g9108 [Coprinellus aureogranulatus]|nr:hypothetical protein NMY22_g9108 [Coprinellus aureogranulatus]